MTNVLGARLLFIAPLLMCLSVSALAAPTTSGFDTMSGDIPFAVKGDEVLDVTPQGLMIPVQNASAVGPLNAVSLATLINLLNTPPCAQGYFLTKVTTTTFACVPGAGASTQTVSNTNTTTVNTTSNVTATANGSASASDSTSAASTSSSASATSCAASPSVCSAYVAGAGTLPDTYTAQIVQSNYNNYISSGMTAAQASAQVTADARNTTRVATRR